jgi:outer membrane protein
MKSTSAAIALIFAMLFAPVLAQAQAAKPVKIGFVNVARLLAEAPQANAANKSLENEFASRQRDLVARQKALKDRSDKLQKDGAVMGEQERRNAENDFRKDEREFARLAEELREDVNVRRNDALGKLRIELLREVEGYAKTNGFDLIVSDGLLYASPSLDVTGQVLAGLQSRFGAKAPAKP